MKRNWGSYLALSMLGFQNATLMFIFFLPGYPISVSVAGLPSSQPLNIRATQGSVSVSSLHSLNSIPDGYLGPKFKISNDSQISFSSPNISCAPPDSYILLGQEAVTLSIALLSQKMAVTTLLALSPPFPPFQ